MKSQSWLIRFSNWLLSKIYDDELYDEIEGDMLELYNERSITKGKTKASLLYLWDTIRSLQNIGLRGKRKSHSQFAAVGSVITITLRSLRKRKLYSSLNIIGLTISICFAFLLWLYITDQQSYDRHFENAERIYRVNADFDMNGKRDVYSNVPQPVAAALKADFPEIEEAVRVTGVGNLEVHTGTLTYENKQIKSTSIFIADPSFFKIFKREFSEGNQHYALTEPNAIVLSSWLAVSIFGTDRVMGKTLYLKDERKYVKVTGVMKDDFRHTHMPVNAIVSSPTFKDQDSQEWYGAHVYTYVLLKEHSSVSMLQSKMEAFYQRHMKKALDSFNGKGILFFQSLTDIHLSPEYVWEPNPHGSKMNVDIMKIVMIFILAFACVNYINLATAFAAERATEIGIRKLLGSSRRLLMIQFLCESVFLAVFSSLLALLMAWIILPYFNVIADTPLTTSDILRPIHVTYVIIMSACVGMFSGLFPAFYLAGIQSLKVLKGKFSNLGGETLRRVLVGSQYFMAAILLTGLIVVGQQTFFIKNRDIGFAKDNLIELTIPMDTTVRRHLDVLKQKLNNTPTVVSTTATVFTLSQNANSFSPTLRNPDGTTFQMGCDIAYVDADFMETIDAHLVAGRNFIKDSWADEFSILINETAMRKFGWTTNPLQGELAGFTPTEPQRAKVVGVVHDFTLGASYQQVHPMIFFLKNNKRTNIMYVRVHGTDIYKSLEEIHKTWRTLYTDLPMEYAFVNDSLNAIYSREERFKNLLTLFSIAVLVIASLGIIGLVSFTAHRRRKEIAIRKVLGSSLRNTVTLLSGKFGSLLVIANVLAAPASYYLLMQWLSYYDYRVDLGVWPFLLSFFTSAFLTLILVAYHTGVAAVANPIEALRSE